VQILSGWEGTVSAHLEPDGNDNVTEIRVVNNSGSTRHVLVSRPGDVVLDATVAPGETLVHPLRGGRRFKLSAASSDWTMELA
jgi:hypothetical protein